MKVTCTCGTEFEARSSKARYCSDRCRKRKGKADAQADLVQLPPAGDGPTRGPVETATIAELEEAGRLDSVLGQACLALARRVDFPGLDTGSALATAVRELKSTLAEAKRGGAARTAPQSLQDELAARRERHGA